MTRQPPIPANANATMRAFWKMAGVAAFVGGFAAACWMKAPASPKPPAMATPAKTDRAREPVRAQTTPVSVTQKSARESIGDALAGDDPLASAARVVAWLDTTTAETFRELANTPEKFPWPTFSGFDSEFRAAYFKAIAERWLALDPGGALPAMQRVQAELDRQNAQGQILEAAAAMQPELVLEKLPLENKHGWLEPHARAALGSLAARDLPAARLFAERWTDSQLRGDAINAITMGVAEKDPLAAVRLVTEMSDQSRYWLVLSAAERIGPGMVRQVLQAAGGRLDPYAISPDFLLRHPDLAADMPNLPVPKNTAFYISDDAFAAADRISPEDRERLLDGYDSLPASARENAAAALVCAWARTEPRKAAEWAVAHGKTDDGASPANNSAQQVFLRWINTDADAALAWWRAQPPSPLRDALGTNASTYLAEDGRLDAALEIFHPGAGETDKFASAQLLQILADRDPREAAARFAKMPASAIGEQTARAVTGAWYARDPEAVARWIETLPAGSARDQAAQSFIMEAMNTSPAGAAQWVGTVADPELRQKAAALVFWQMRMDDPGAAREWLSQLRGVDAEWQARTLRRSP